MISKIPMDQTTLTISKIFNGEGRSYSRFSLTQDADGETNQVELKTSRDGDEEAGETLGGSFSQQTYAPQRWRSPKHVAMLVGGFLFFFVVGLLLGSTIFRRQPKLQTPADVDECPLVVETSAKVDVILDWDDVRNMLQSKLSPEIFKQCFENFKSTDHEAGSDGEMQLGEKIIELFKNLDMNPWKDHHFVKLQRPVGTSVNRVSFGTELVGEPLGYLAYSASGTKQGRIIYSHYGQEEDFKVLLDKNINVTKAVVLMRAGKISFAEKVANAAKLGAVAVLIYPDPVDINCGSSCEMFGHIHMGTGDPYTPGFPSFNHTQFLLSRSSGLPGILAQTITPIMASTLLRKMRGDQPAPEAWRDSKLSSGISVLLGRDSDLVTVEVNTTLIDKELVNIFGVIRGFMEPDHYVVLGAQRDAWGPGFAKSTVGTCLLVELAKATRAMVKNGDFRPRRSIMFASWSGGDYGSVGATEWLEGYLMSLNMKAYTYISLDAVVTGYKTFKASASPMLYKLMGETLKEVKSPVAGTSSSLTLYSDFAGTNWYTKVMTPMKMSDPAYPFLAFSGIPSVSFRFESDVDIGYHYYGTLSDTQDNLDYATGRQLTALTMSAAQVAGTMMLRLVHDHLLRLDVEHYKTILRMKVVPIIQQLDRKAKTLQQNPAVSNHAEAITSNWLRSAMGSFTRATNLLIDGIRMSDLSDIEICQRFNDRIMRVEGNLLSPYKSPQETPFRHILFGSGSHTLQSLLDNVIAVGANATEENLNLLREQLALATWTIQGSANALAGNMWELDNQI
ncbi:transferrin receptor protein 1-like isoform X2 [Brienomyrus brachyistius]|uniref:transferrin receptor protein 1-like isoform X2 n=1 Tax=Brienomyrus brachyistius TaxID=42636 RepID=UPI0020B37E34|nr:transferrin receptor protein 1-like isoform X2 [Brienomyrus brachyistius]